MLTNGDTPPRSARIGGRARALPPGEELEKLIKRGMTQAMIGQRYGVSYQAVSKELKKHRGGAQRNSSQWQKYWPTAWFDQLPQGNGIKTAHASAYTYKRLVAWTKRRQGVKLDDNATLLLDQFLEHLRKNRLVVYYLYDSPNGFFMRTRREHDDPEVIWADGP